MKKILIIGSSPAGVKAAEEIRQKDKESKISMLSVDGFYPYDRNLFADYLSKDVLLNDLYCFPEKFYQDNKIDVICDRQITRINFNRCKVFTEEKEQIDYDVLVICDLPLNAYPDIKGKARSGVFGMKKLKDIEGISKTLDTVDTISVQSNSVYGLNLAVALAKSGKEIYLILGENNFLSSCFDDSVVKNVVNQLDEKGIHLVLNESIVEVLGEKDAKAIKLRSKKVIVSQMVIFDVNADLRLLKDSNVNSNTRIIVNSDFKTSIDNVYAVDSIASTEDQLLIKNNITNKEALQEQGRVVASVIFDEKIEGVYPLLVESVKYDDFSISCVGNVRDTEETSQKQRFDEENRTFRKVFLKDNCVVGAVLLNQEKEVDKYLRLIKEKDNLISSDVAYFDQVSEVVSQ
ncbi:MAG: FAD-dependent oxidoreductase [Candidatus Omnitrophica bacterium]|nr:FAD-dependent oxidoreductase [Candidatus Omnitrophota bacterium]